MLRLGRTVVEVALGLLLLVWAALAYHLWDLYQERVEAARRQSAQLAQALEVSIAQNVRAIDFALDSLAAGIGRLTDDELEGGAIRRLLSEDYNRIAAPLDLLYVDAGGRGVASSANGFMPGRDYSDREYFTAHQQGGQGLFVSSPLLGRTLGKRFLPFSRPVIDRVGQPRGVLMASLDVRQFEESFARFAGGPNSVITLLHDSGRVVARFPEPEAYFGRDVRSSILFRELLARAPAGDYEAHSATDGVERTIHYQRIGETPLVLAIGFSRRDIVAGLAGDIVSHVIAGGAFMLLMLLGLRTLRREQLSLRSTSRRLADSERRYHGLYDSLRDGVVMRSRDGLIRECNPAFARMVGYRRDELIGRPIARLLGDGGEERLAAANAQIDYEGHAAEAERAYCRRDGSSFWAKVVGWRPAGSEAAGDWYWELVHDVTEHREMLHRLGLSQKIIANSGEAMLITDAQNRIIAVNPAFERITGYPAAEVLGRNPSILASGRHDQAFYAAMWAALGRDGCWQGEIWDKRRSGEIYPKQLLINAIHEDGALSNYVAVFSDISERKQQEEKINFLAHHDALTGLPNRPSLEAYLEGALARAHRNGEQLAVLFVDLDNFKTINDSLGHHAGDELLCAVARALKGACRESDYVARLGGDEFVVLIEGLKQVEAIAGVVQKILRAFAEPFPIREHELHTSPSIGISLYPSDGGDASTLMRNADTAMYYAKSSGRNTYQFFAEPMNQAANRRLHLESELWNALANDELLLHYQPQIDLVSRRIVGVEALVRWQHPEKGMIPPADFIPVAEETGLILPIGHWVLRTACRQGREWLDQGRDVGDIAVNISAHQFRQPEFAASVRAVLAETGLPPERLELEITESAVMNSADSSVRVLAELKEMGVKLAIDDFGTGYSSLSYLRRFPIDRLKIDRSFVADVDTDLDAASLVESIIALGKSLGLRLVAEGVENAAQAEFLREKNCERVQGFYFHRPSPPESVLEEAAEG